ncbi:MAG: outer membrane beta-barrel protein [Salinivirgaceae bacterium]|nr:outer membrane beta-barrel protein [Salinivirgaceae bacterium]
MKKILILFLSIFLITQTHAGNEFSSGNRVPVRGNSFVNFGIGASSWGVPIYAGMEWMVNNEISLGGQVSFRSQSETIAGSSYQHNAFSLAARGNYYFNHLLKIDPPFLVYAGASLGFVSVSTSTRFSDGVAYDGSRGTGTFFGIHTGGAYFFNKHWAVNAELGFGNVIGLKMGAIYLF